MANRIHIENGNDSFLCPDGLDVLRGMECLGRKGIPVGCRGGGCGVCKVRVISGRVRTETMSCACVSDEERAQGYALACKLFALEELRLEVVGKMARSFGSIGGTFHFYGTPSASSTQKV